MPLNRICKVFYGICGAAIGGILCLASLAGTSVSVGVMTIVVALGTLMAVLRL